MSGLQNDLGRKFQCFRCGVCCTRYQVRIELPEAKNIAERLSLSLSEFLNLYTDSRWPGKDSFLIRHQNGKCIFLKSLKRNKVTRCIIHSFRPQDCQNWTPDIGKPECQQGLSKWDLKINSTGELNGPIENLRQFFSFLKSLD
jgi:Fe-S-cluster containining protein